MDNNIPYVTYGYLSPRDNNGTGKLAIEGLAVSTTFMSRLWAQMKKRIKKEYGVDVTATFYRNNDNGRIVCSFFRSCAYAQQHKIDPRLYEKRFEDTFPHWVNDFEQVIERISFDLLYEDNKERIIDVCFPEKKTRRERSERKARKAAAKAAKKSSKKDNPIAIDKVDTAKASV